MTPTRVRPTAALAGLLTLLLLASAAPASAGGPWRAKGAEDVAVRLTNCIRSGGHVTQAGKCRGWGSGRYSKTLPNLRRSSRISSKVTWPWAKRSATFYGTRRCWVGHSRNGSTVDTRFSSANFQRAIANGENMGCALYGDSRKSVVLIVRMWQAERQWGGPHWRQIKDRDFRSIGIGVARYGARKTQLVVNFYGKLID